MQLTLEDLQARPAAYRRDLINTLPGPRGVHLIGTKGYKGTENLAVFSSVVHVGASPPLLGFIMRPLTVPRHTYHHIKANQWFTLNTLHPDILEAAHQTSANYAIKDSEFAATGLTPQYSDRCKAPYVKESRVKIGLTLEEEHHIGGNGTLFLIGRVQEIFVPDEAVAESGHVDHQLLRTLTVAGLDTYQRTTDPVRLSYARPGNKR
ncbi:flavin reductase (DIM6/NTAB) family NADH-FMN oxidoreductase RutF [Neolewinella xylanilytica]|uniref:Flavin reductase (DIM6/NTAB) family NADH-FMN oxidoreductase RutF n=1 Tax=Neolewinella xylanilytica TaxID=1514080 RepID=A0A2S6I738_9BACT|nr:flavin reductase family protein [Neolewinella xylanilytica]PPK87269.1 flavin reductase (DIM6/NTAB) family NADH-FMN oxidoreductase RutF [Neolewinella xylanilytica]